MAGHSPRFRLGGGLPSNTQHAFGRGKYRASIPMARRCREPGSFPPIIPINLFVESSCWFYRARKLLLKMPLKHLSWTCDKVTPTTTSPPPTHTQLLEYKEWVIKLTTNLTSVRRNQLGLQAVFFRIMTGILGGHGKYLEVILSRNNSVHWWGVRCFWQRRLFPCDTFLLFLLGWVC